MFPGDGHPELAHVSEVRQTEQARSVFLAEDDVHIGAMKGPPSPHPPFECPTDPWADLGVPATKLFKYCDRTHLGGGLQNRNDLTVPRYLPADQAASDPVVP